MVELQKRSVQAEPLSAAAVDVVADDGAVEALGRRGVYAQLVRTARERTEEYACAAAFVSITLYSVTAERPSADIICRGRFS